MENTSHYKVFLFSFYFLFFWQHFPQNVSQLCFCSITSFPGDAVTHVCAIPWTQLCVFSHHVCPVAGSAGIIAIPFTQHPALGKPSLLKGLSDVDRERRQQADERILTGTSLFAVIFSSLLTLCFICFLTEISCCCCCCCPARSLLNTALKSVTLVRLGINL